MQGLLWILLITLLNTGCKKNPQSGLSARDTGLDSRFNSTMFVPFSNVGYDPAFCAASSAVHALVANRARFYQGTVPSQKCPSKWTQKDDANYDQKVWQLIEQEVAKQDFVSEPTIKIFGAYNFYQYGSRNLHLFAPMIRRLQDTLQWARNWKNAVNADLVPFNKLAEIARQNNFMIIFVHKSDINPDQLYAKTSDSLRLDCESRGYRWDQNTNQCDWATKNQELANPNPNNNSHPQPLPNSPQSADFNGDSTVSPYYSPMPRKLNGELNVPDIPKDTYTNHAILVTGAFDDRTLQVYTTWTENLLRWRADLSVELEGKPIWMSQPVVMETIPIKVDDDRTNATDLMAELNAYYGYTGANASDGCPGTGLSPPSNTPVSANAAYFSFTLRVGLINQRTHVIVENIKGCSAKKISWAITKTGYNPNKGGATFDEQMVAHGRWSSELGDKSTAWPVDADINRMVVTGACGNQTFSWPVFGQAVDGGTK